MDEITNKINTIMGQVNHLINSRLRDLYLLLGDNKFSMSLSKLTLGCVSHSHLS